MQGWDWKGEEVPEVVLREFRAASSLGPVAGPVGRVEGFWNSWEWFPTIIAASRYIKTLPSDLGTLSRIDWIPADLLASIIIELTLLSPTTTTSTLSLTNISTNPTTTSTSTTTTRVYHTVNPLPTPYPTILTHFPPNTATVPWAEWVCLLRSSADDNDNLGIKLLAFFEGTTEGKVGGGG